jgi:hypothetical protein
MRGKRESREAATGSDGHRSGRGLGPFTSGHLTIIVVAFVVVVAFPFAAGAVTGNNSFITDFTSGAHAKVDAAGNLGATVNGATSGKKADVTQAQQLLTTDAPPTSFLLGTNPMGVVGPQGENGSFVCVKIAAPDPGKAAVVSEINLTAATVTPPPGNQSTITVIFFVAPSGSPCTGPTVARAELTAPGQTVALPLGSGVSIPATQALFALASVNDASPGTGGTVNAFAYGYDVVPADVGFVAR